MLDTIWQVCIIGISTHETLNRKRIKMTKKIKITSGKTAYETDLKNRPYYDGGKSRETWEKLSEIAKWSWERK